MIINLVRDLSFNAFLTTDTAVPGLDQNGALNLNAALTLSQTV